MFSGVEVRWLWRKVHDCQHSLLFFGLQGFLKGLSCVWTQYPAASILSTNIHHDSKACLWRMECCFSLLGLESPCGFDPLWSIFSPAALLTFTLLLLTLVSKWTSSVNWTFLHHPLWNAALSEPTPTVLFLLLRRALETLLIFWVSTAFFWQDFCCLDSCVLYWVKSGSVIKLLT